MRVSAGPTGCVQPASGFYVREGHSFSPNRTLSSASLCFSGARVRLRESRLSISKNT